MPSCPAIEPASVGWRFDNSYARLPDSFFTRIRPVAVRAPRIALVNQALAEALGLDLDVLSAQQAADIFSGNNLPAGAEPIAQAYAGHQFGYFAVLGDGRAIVLGEHLAPDGQRFDIQLKGSGQTPYSRRGDGRAALGPMLREYVISQAMAALGIPTTRSLAVVTTGEGVFRESVLPGAILTRVAASHIRVGTFEYIASRNDLEELRQLADYAIWRHYPHLAASDRPYLELLEAIAERQASLVAQWLHVGFVHGVMNTDNMAISGETIDYGPCAFMDTYDPATVFSSIDHQGRYAYANQPPIAQWNLARLAEALLPLFDADANRALPQAEAALASFADRFQQHWLAGMRKKIGIGNEEVGDAALIRSLLDWMQHNKADFTATFRALSTEMAPESELFRDRAFIDWHEGWRQRLARAPRQAASPVDLMRASNPARIARNHLVEEALEAASEHGDLGPLHRLLAALARPYADDPQFADYATPPAPGEAEYQTFCGT